jgi:cold shock CspA family protein
MSRVIGCVKWFNNKTGFGFITHQDEDIFVHHHQLKVKSDQYRYLVQGEYVEFEKTMLNDNQHKCMASNVTGVHGGFLMCETRQKSMDSREPREAREPRVLREPREPRVKRSS